MKDPQDKKLLDIYHGSRLETPSELLDKKIHKTAKAALYRKRKRWLWGLSTAAVILISFNVVVELLFMDEQVVELQPSQAPLESREPYITAKPKVQNNPEHRSEFHSLRPALEQADVIEQLSLAAEEDFSDSDRAFDKENTKHKLHKMEKKMLSRQRELASSGMSAPAASEVLKPDVISVDLPDLPSELNQLLELDSRLSGTQISERLIILSIQDKLVLSVKKDQGYIHYKAWRGSEVLGVKVDWDLGPDYFSGCRSDPVYITCDLTPEVQGFFEDKRLDHISWKRADE